MHLAAANYLAEHRPPSTIGLHVLEFGARNINGSARDIVGRCARYVGVDIAPGDGVDIVADAATVTVHGGFDVVICCEVFEHTDDGTCAAIVANAHRHLIPGGMFVATMAGPGRKPHSAVDGHDLQPGEFYRNVDRPLLHGWLVAAGFQQIETDILGDDLRCVARR